MNNANVSGNPLGSHAPPLNRQERSSGENQGEGDRVSARHYNEQLREFVAGGKVDPAARDAKSYVERQPDEAARAERKAKRGPHGTRVSIDQLVALGNNVIERVRPTAERVIGRIRARIKK